MKSSFLVPNFANNSTIIQQSFLTLLKMIKNKQNSISIVFKRHLKNAIIKETATPNKSWTALN